MKIGFIGFGNIAQAMAQGLLEKNPNISQEMFASSAHYNKLKKNTDIYGITACKSNQETVDCSDIIFVCVKPYQVKEVLSQLQFKDQIIISLVGGMYHEDYTNIIPNTHHIVCIPNTAISVAEGVIVVENKHSLTDEQFKIVES